MENKKIITITIDGATGVGKSRVGHKIIATLKKAGFIVKLSPEVFQDYDDESHYFKCMEKNTNIALDVIKEKSKILMIY